MDALEVGSPVPDLTLSGEGGREIRLSQLWRRAPTVFVFLRHFG